MIINILYIIFKKMFMKRSMKILEPIGEHEVYGEKQQIIISLSESNNIKNSIEYRKSIIEYLKTVKKNIDKNIDEYNQITYMEI